MKITKRSQLPKCIRHFKQVKGICIGQCIDKDDTIDKKHVAHAHSHRDNAYRGWICLRYKYRLRQKLTLLHEVAHLIANSNPKTPTHGKKWKQAVVQIGGTFQAFEYRIGNWISINIDYTHRHNMN